MTAVYKFGQRSLNKLATVDPRLREVMIEALAKGLIDFAVVEGRRSKERQEALLFEGRTKVHWPNSKHNVVNPDDLAKAVDVVPWVNGKPSYHREHCIFLAGVIRTVAVDSNINLRWGGNWDRDGEPITDQRFDDLVHFEIDT